MPAVVLKVPPWEGRYDFEDWRFTNRELNAIKMLSGVRAAELVDAIWANDRAACLALAVVVLDRHGKQVTAEDLWDTKVDELTIEFDKPGAADPPTQPASEDDLKVTDASSGDDSSSDGESPANPQPPTGTPSSETLAA